MQTVRKRLTEEGRDGEIDGEKELDRGGGGKGETGRHKVRSPVSQK